VAEAASSSEDYCDMEVFEEMAAGAEGNVLQFIAAAGLLESEQRLFRDAMRKLRANET
jgi:hypothetical protein